MSGTASAHSGPAKRPPVLLLGAHRSGTTATARALHLLGLQLGQRLDSHHEPKGMQRLHDRYLQNVGAAWHRPGPFLDSLATTAGETACADYLQDHTRRQFPSVLGYRNNLPGWWLRARLRSGAAWGWKEPRTTLFAPAWLKVFPGALVIEVVRHPLAVAMSIRQREMEFRARGDAPKPGLDQLDYCLRLALTYVEAGGNLARLTTNYRRIRFEELQANPQKILQELANFCQLQPTPERLAGAAASIKPDLGQWRENLPKAMAHELMQSHPLVHQLGYR